jgi:hypothetical protein
MSSTKRRSGFLAPREFIACMRAKNQQFAGTQHQDAQEFLIWLLNACNDELVEDAKAEAKEQEAALAAAAAQAKLKDGGGGKDKDKTSEKDKKETKKPDKKPKQSFSTTTVSTTHHSTNSSSSTSSTTVTLNQFDSLPALISQAPLSPADTMLPPAAGVGSAVFGAKQTTTIAEPPVEQPSILLQTIAALQQQPPDNPSTLTPISASAAPVSPVPSRPLSSTFIQHLFEGSLTNRTRCSSCLSLSARAEAFFDLSLEVEPDVSLTQALERFEQKEAMERGDKYACATCLCHQEALKSLHISSYPRILVTHLKRFRWHADSGTFVKCADRVTFPMELVVQADGAAAAGGTTSGATVDPSSASAASLEKRYELTAVVVHIGSSLRHGHYVALSQVGGQWFCYDDDDIHLWTQEDVRTVYGSCFTGEKNGHLDGYLLFYAEKDLEQQMRTAQQFKA